MATRHTLSIVYKGEFVVVQSAMYDGFIESQGVDILEFLLVPGNIQRLKDGLEFITIVDLGIVLEIQEEHSESINEQDIYDNEDWNDDNFQEICHCGGMPDFRYYQVHWIHITVRPS